MWNLVGEGFDEKVKRPVIAKFARRPTGKDFNGGQGVIAIKRFEIFVKDYCKSHLQLCVAFANVSTTIMAFQGIHAGGAVAQQQVSCTKTAKG